MAPRRGRAGAGAHEREPDRRQPEPRRPTTHGRSAGAPPTGSRAPRLRPLLPASRTSPSSTTACAAGGSTSMKDELKETFSDTSAPAARRRVTTDDELRAASQELSLELVLTAHPTEAARRTVLEKHRRIAALLHRLDDAELELRRGAHARAARRRDHDPSADRRGALEPTTSSTRSGRRSGSSRRASGMLRRAWSPSSSASAIRN